jgi:hypothetical protein
MLKSVFLIFALIIVPVVPASAEDSPNINRVISWEDSVVIAEYPTIRAEKNGSFVPCEGGWSSSCDPQANNLMIDNFLPLCVTAEGMDKRVDCLNEVHVEINGKKIIGQIVPKQVGIVESYSFFGKPEVETSKSVPYQFYRFAGLKHPKGDLFSVQAQKSYSIEKGKVIDRNYTFFIAPAYQAASAYDCAHLNTPNNLCWIVGSFDLETKFSLSVKMANKPVGWFTGRVTDSSVQIGGSPDMRTDLTFTGTSQSIPAINRNYFYNNPIERAEWTEIAKNIPRWSWDVMSKDGKRYSMGAGGASDSIAMFEEISSRLPSFNNADTLKNIWRFESKSYLGDSLNTNCLKSGFIGVVSSNSMTYENAIPTWDPDTSSLVYSMASPHTALGKEFIGRYDLLISEQVGKCLWSLNSLSPSAEISVTGSKGEKKVITASSKIVDGFYKFTATGFTFSSNKVSVKMLSEGTRPMTVVDPALPTTKSAPLKQTVTCIKGKTQKKVTAVKPKCPTGYKKK